MPTSLRSFATLLVFFSVLSGLGFGLQIKNVSLAISSADAAVPIPEATPTPTSATANSVFTPPALIGTYRPNGLYAPKPRSIQALYADPRSERTSEQAVPGWISRDPIERVVENVAPPARAAKPVRGQSLFSTLRDRVVTLAYGRESVLFAPGRLVTDSRNRLIVTDPSEPAVHVLDGRDSFRIAGGAGRRMLRPTSVAVDAEDNIYVTDEKLALILVYDCDGRYLRTLGDYHGESIFARPSSIAIDRRTRLIYVLDAPVNQLLVLTLEGRVTRRVGTLHGNARLTFADPKAIALGANQIAVADNSGSRIRIFDLDFNPLTEFAVGELTGPPRALDLGIALDRSGNVYISNLPDSKVRVFSQTSQLLATLDTASLPYARLLNPTAIWIDEFGRVFISDTGNSRIQVYLPTTANTAASQQ
jgi:DNA-binding beta-propeller fold protein YncE